MKATSLIHIAIDSFSFCFKNIKTGVQLAIVPFIVLNVLSIFNVYTESDSIILLTAILSAIILIPYSIKWIQKTLKNDTKVQYEHGFLWNENTTVYLIKYIKYTATLILALTPVLLISGALFLFVTRSELSHPTAETATIILTSLYIPLFLIGLWVLTLGFRMSLILPSYVEGKNITIKSAIKSTKNTSTAILLSGSIYVVISIIILVIYTLVSGPIFSIASEQDSLFLNYIIQIINNIFAIFFTATKASYTAMMYKKLMA